jgi:hypothetical protein
MRLSPSLPVERARAFRAPEWTCNAGRSHTVAMGKGNPSGESPTEILEGLFARVAKVAVAADPPGNEWNFALGALFALGSMGHLDEETILRYEERIQAEANRIGNASKRRHNGT